MWTIQPSDITLTESISSKVKTFPDSQHHHDGAVCHLMVLAVSYSGSESFGLITDDEDSRSYDGTGLVLKSLSDPTRPLYFKRSGVFTFRNLEPQEYAAINTGAEQDIWLV